MVDVRVVTNELGVNQHPRHIRGEFSPEHAIPLSTSERHQHGVWKVANRATAGTTIIVEPNPNTAIMITDLIVSTDKVANSSCLLQFTDDVDIEVIARFDTANAPVALSISINGRLHGWKDARLEMNTVSTVNATFMVGYVNIPSTQDFAVWDAARSNVPPR